MSDNIYSIQKGENTQIRFTLGEYNGKPNFHIRVYYRDRDTGQWCPSKNGVAMERDKFPEFCKGFEALTHAIQEHEG